MTARDPRAPHGASLLSLSFHRLMRAPRAVHRAYSARASIFQTRRNTDGLYQAERGSFLIDADQFFRCVAESLARAEKQVLIVGWDTDTRTELPLPSDDGLGYQWPDDWKRAGCVQLGELIHFLIEKKPELCVSVLSWDFAFIYLFERESFPSVKFSSLNHRSDRVRFVLDQEHPTLASHHQKIVVIDDEVAFSGGLDLTQRRWDTPEHKGQDLRRVDPEGHLYGPFHDVQFCVSGAIAKALGDLVRRRWKTATGEDLREPISDGSRIGKTAWPPSARIDIEKIDVAISRTAPPVSGKRFARPVQQVEKLFLDAIASAKSFVYLENQYFTSPVIARAIAKRLREPGGPEFVLVLPRDQTGWIEESTMGLLRSRALRLVEAADVFNRFRAYYPVVPSLEEGYVKVHSKVMVIDDQFVRIGSANMNNRSMGLDTECDLAIEANGRTDIVTSIARLRRELLGEHLGVEPAEFDARFLLNGSLVDTVESFLGRPRTLVPMHPTVPEWVGHLSPPRSWIDPSAPMGIRRWFFKKAHASRSVIAMTLIIGLFVSLLSLAFLEERGMLPFGEADIPRVDFQAIFAWLSSWNGERVAGLIQNLKAQPWEIPAVLLGMTLGSFIFVPITAMFVGLAIVYDPFEALALSLSGGVISSFVLYSLGHYWSFAKSRFLNRPIVKTISSKIKKGGVAAMTAIRMTPIAPFTVVSVVAGGLGIRVRDYLLGTFFGLLPGALALSLVSTGARSAQSTGHYAVFISLAVLALAVVTVLPKLFVKWRLRGQA